MPVITVPAMTQQEHDEFCRAMQEILLAQADNLCSIDLRPDGDGAQQLSARVNRRSGRAQAIEQALDIARRALDSGKAVVNSRNGIPRLDPAVIRKRHDYPVEYMTPEEQESFHRAVERVNRAVRAGECEFESDLDGEARIYFRYFVRDHARDRKELFDSIDLIVRQVHAGRAVRMEMPGGGVMLIPRWDLRPDPAVEVVATGGTGRPCPA